MTPSGLPRFARRTGRRTPDAEPRWHGLAVILVPAVLTVVATAIQASGAPVGEWLRFDRLAIQQGQWWRLLSGHLVHLGWSHLMLNLAGLWLIWSLFGRDLGVWGGVWVALWGMLGISLGLLYWSPQVQWYVGLSGVLHALLVGGAVLAWGSGRRTLVAGLLMLVLVKLGWEQLIGPVPGSEAGSGGPVVVDAHLYGALCGAVAGAVYRAWLGGLERRGARQRPSD